jgi:O-antigen/teichoic acid export membrane protein
MSEARKIFANFSYLFFAQIISQVFGFVAVVYLARVLGADGFGIIAFAQAIVSYFSLGTDLGLTRFGTREVARDIESAKTHAGRIIGLRFVLAVISFIVLLVFIFLSGRTPLTKYVLVCFGLFLFINSLQLDWFFRGIEKMKFIAISGVIERLIFMVLVLAVIQNASSVKTVPYLYLIGSTVSAAFLLYVLFKEYGRIPITFEYANCKQMLLVSLPMALGSLMVRINNNFDSVFLGFMKDEKVVGLYTAAYKIILIVFLVGGFYITAIFPVASRYYRESIPKLQTLLSNSARILLGVGIPLAVGGIILAKPVILFVYGIGYIDSVLPLQILLFYVPISFITMVYADSLIACDRQNEYAIGVGISAISNVSLNLLLIPSYGMIGAASATVMSELVLLWFASKKLTHVVHVPFVRYIWKPLQSAVLMGILLYFCSGLNVFILVTLGIVSYMVFYVLVGGCSFAELRTATSKIHTFYLNKSIGVK